MRVHVRFITGVNITRYVIGMWYCYRIQSCTLPTTIDQLVNAYNLSVRRRRRWVESSDERFKKSYRIVTIRKHPDFKV